MDEKPEVVLLRDLVNAYEPQTDEESWDSPAALHDWLTDRQLLPASARLTSEELDRARAIREGLRSVLLGHAGHDGDPAAVARMQDALGAPRLRLGVDGLVVAPAAGRPFEAVVASVLDAVRRSQADGTWDRLKACERETCHWAYFDASRNRSRRWCSMAGCGNVLKMRRRAARG